MTFEYVLLFILSPTKTNLLPAETCTAIALIPNPMCEFGITKDFSLFNDLSCSYH